MIPIIWFIFHLIKGDVIKDKEGNVIDNELYQACRKLLTEMGFKSWGFLCGPDGARIVSSDCGRYHRQVVVKTNSPDQIREGRTAEEMLMDLRQFVDITQKIGDVVNTYTTVYEAADKVQYERPADEKLPPLDYYLTDEGVLEELKRNIDNDFLNPEFVKNYYDVACAYFNPYRTDLPESVRSYGFPIGSALSEMGDCKRKSRVDLEDLKQFPLNE